LNFFLEIERLDFLAFARAEIFTFIEILRQRFAPLNPSTFHVSYADVILPTSRW